jgi:rhomboid protease GluP
VIELEAPGDPGTPDEPGIDVRTTTSIERAGDWALVLHSVNVDHRIDIRDGTIVIAVPAHEHASAVAALDAFDLENARVPEVPAPDLGPTSLGLGFAVLLVALHAAAGARDAAPASVWFREGSASAEAIVRGEWWRTITALMLHADLLHLAGNVVGSLIFVSAVGRWLGVGLGGVAILAAAASANWLTAMFYQVRHVSVGASTATFAALGVIAGLQMVRRFGQRERLMRRAAWLPLAAGLGLIVMLGSSERADIVAHVFGLGMGIVAGLAVGVAGLRAPGPLGQGVLTAVVLAGIAAAWLLAFAG